MFLYSQGLLIIHCIAVAVYGNAHILSAIDYPVLTSLEFKILSEINDPGNRNLLQIPEVGSGGIGQRCGTYQFAGAHRTSIGSNITAQVTRIDYSLNRQELLSLNFFLKQHSPLLTEFLEERLEIVARW